MKDKISVCITIKDRTELMIGKLRELVGLDFDPKRMEVCVTDGADDSVLRSTLMAWAHEFDRIKYAVSDRTALPFVVPENNPACDINAQVCHVATYDKIVRTDPEVRFRRRDSLKWAINALAHDRELCVCFKSWHMDANYRDGLDQKMFVTSAAKMSFHCSCFWKRAFVENCGVEEAFARGFAAEDSYFHQWWRKNRRLVHPPAGHEVLHLWHGRWQSENRLRLKHKYSLPLYKKMLRENKTPNEGNPNWTRPEMIKNVQTWKA